MSNVLPDHFPSIVIDREYGAHVDDIDVDIHFIAQRLKEAGISDEDIDTLHIHFTQPSKRELKRSQKEGLHTMGRYRSKKDRIEMLAIPHMQLVQSIYNEPLDDGKFNETLCQDPRLINAINRHVNEDLSKTLNHELEHAIAERDEDLQQQKRAYLRKSRPKLVDGLSVTYFGTMGAGIALEAGAGVEYGFETATVIAVSALVGFNRRNKRAQALKLYEIYFNNPCEIRARSVEEGTPDTLVRVAMSAAGQKVI